MDEAGDPTKIFGWIAVSISLIYKFPQIWKLYRTEDISGISVFSQCVQASAYIFYIIHGILIADPPIVFLGITSGLQSMVLILQYYYYSTKEKLNLDTEGEVDECTLKIDGEYEAV